MVRKASLFVAWMDAVAEQLLLCQSFFIWQFISLAHNPRRNQHLKMQKYHLLCAT